MQIIEWNILTDLQRNAIIAEKVMGWKWIEHLEKGELWLLPDKLSTTEVSSGDTVWYIKEEEVWPEGNVSPLPHKDKRSVPYWLPHYTTHMDAAWDIVDRINTNFILTRTDTGTCFGHFSGGEPRVHTFAETPQIVICIDALRLLGYEVKDR